MGFVFPLFHIVTVEVFIANRAAAVGGFRQIFGRRLYRYHDIGTQTAEGRIGDIHFHLAAGQGGFVQRCLGRFKSEFIGFGFHAVCAVGGGFAHHAGNLHLTEVAGTGGFFPSCGNIQLARGGNDILADFAVGAVMTPKVPGVNGSGVLQTRGIVEVRFVIHRCHQIVGFCVPVENLTVTYGIIAVRAAV